MVGGGGSLIHFPIFVPEFTIDKISNALCPWGKGQRCWATFSLLNLSSKMTQVPKSRIGSSVLGEMWDKKGWLMCRDHLKCRGRGASLFILLFQNWSNKVLGWILICKLKTNEFFEHNSFEFQCLLSTNTKTVLPQKYTQLGTHFLCFYSYADGVERTGPKRKNQGSERSAGKEPRVSSSTNVDIMFHYYFSIITRQLTAARLRTGYR